MSAGDKGKTTIIGQRVPKDVPVIEALGTLDELNAWLGVCKAVCMYQLPSHQRISDYVTAMQHDLFIIQAELAGAGNVIGIDKVNNLEKIINDIEIELPQRDSFCLPGGTKLSAHLDYARTVARRAERKVVAYSRQHKVDDTTLAYMNRISSAIYAMARYINLKDGYTEVEPTYK